MCLVLQLVQMYVGSFEEKADVKGMEIVGCGYLTLSSSRVYCVLYENLCRASFSNPSVASLTSQVNVNPPIALPTSQALHLRHLGSRPC